VTGTKRPTGRAEGIGKEGDEMKKQVAVMEQIDFNRLRRDLQTLTAEEEVDSDRGAL